MPKRLSERQKSEILQSFECGKSIESLSKQFNCTKVTIKRNLKKNLGELKFNELINKNKSLKANSYIHKEKEGNFLDPEIDNHINENRNYLKSFKENRVESDFTNEESFFEIAPLDYKIDKSSRKELSSVPISDIDLPNVVYMIVDKKIELEIKLLKDFPEWDFLPDDDLKRQTLEIFFDLKLAKKSCNKEQKVLKVPNTDVFRIAAPVLIEKGISRIVCPKNLIAL
ncbi:hypothetical protein HA149_06940 [Prochlorococcus marinus XMU1406]|uniref:hypothetical protein n=1 Tax=Prochlorococcus marinus TaxID=1219 RepID=UPI001ADC378E|nr:hypothetical protein [Prochlorococcus marinus]MBO8206793.1 hypothetical protein [Prochlorococcus marinus XMU1406]MCR8542612.1 hypothetical protein [Prochlorococcus marinus XMU1427]